MLLEKVRCTLGYRHKYVIFIQGLMYTLTTISSSSSINSLASFISINPELLNWLVKD